MVEILFHPVGAGLEELLDTAGCHRTRLADVLATYGDVYRGRGC